jgi:tetratricopeptide (TPR) repeat protein
MLIRRDGQAAVQWARRAARLQPEGDVVLGLLGDALAFTGDYPGAREAWLAAAQTAASNTGRIEQLASRDLNVARRMEMRRDHPQAERFYLRAIVLDPKRKEAAEGLVRMLLKHESPAAAAAWAAYLVELDPKHPMPHVLRGDALAAGGDRSAASEHWRRALELDPTHREARNRVSSLQD